MARPIVDVVVVTFNTRDLTVGALRRLLDTDQGADLRVLVQDNASSDGTVAALAQVVPEADVVAGSSNLGFARGVNEALARSTAPWVLLLNSDAWPKPGAVARLVRTADSSPAAGLVVPRLERADGSLEHSTHPFPSLRIAALMAIGAPRWVGRSRLRRWAIEGHWLHDAPRTVDWAVGAAWLVRREALDAVGGLDERYFMYVEDLEWCWRARRMGWQVRFEPEAVVVHVGNASGAAVFGSERTAAHLRNLLRFYRREHGMAAAAAYRALNTAGCLRGWARDRLVGNTARAAWWKAQVKVHLGRVGEVDLGASPSEAQSRQEAPG